MRNLATIQRITNILPIKDADKIEVAEVLGWQCVIAKADGFKIGDLVVYIEIDSIVPDIPAFEFMRDRKFRVRTIKLRGQVSQGLVMPLRLFKISEDISEGKDVTAIIGVRKYDPQYDAEQKMLAEMERAKGNQISRFMRRSSLYRRIFMPKKIGFPAFISKTDEVRIQNVPHFVKYLQGVPLYATEKLDGQSATYFLLRNPRKWQFWNKYIFGVCSRNIYLAKPDNSSYWKIARSCDVKDTLAWITKNYLSRNFVAIQGEIVGPGIQENKYKLSELRFYAFNLIIDGFRMSYTGMHDIISDANVDMQCVPLISDSFYLGESVSKTIDLAKGKSRLNPDVDREGLVIRDYDDDKSFKAINPDFLLKYE